MARPPASVVLRNLLPPAQYRIARDVAIERARSPSDPLVEENAAFGRRFVHNDPQLKDIHESLVPTASKLTGIALKKSYSFLSLYGTEGIAPPHKDRRESRFVINLCIHQDKRWPIYVDEKEFLLGENDAVFFCGSRLVHHRPKIEGKFCRVASFFFVASTFRGALCRPDRA
jgi:hypothetical protein